MFKRRLSAPYTSTEGYFTDSSPESAKQQVAPYSYRSQTTVSPTAIFASPHSGTCYPDELRKALRVPLLDLRRIEDAFVDELFEAVPSLGGGLLSANYARAYVDLNRAKDELDARMFKDAPTIPAGERTPRVEAGLGCIPRVGARGVDIYARKLRRAEAEFRLQSAYDPYHSKLDDLIACCDAEHGGVVLIDCHSMPSASFGRHMSADFVLGDRYGTSCFPELTGLVETSLRRLGYSVVRNAPYAGGYVTESKGAPLQNHHALQIEINRALYMDEACVTRNKGFDVLRQDISALVQEIMSWSQDLMSSAKKSRAIQGAAKS